MRIHFDPQTRAGMTVAMVIAQEVINYTTYGRESLASKNDDFRPVLHSVNGDRFSFEDGVAVRISMEKLDSPRERPQEWVVLSAEVRFYRIRPHGSRYSEKITEVWDTERLRRLRASSFWQWPIVASADYLRERERFQSAIRAAFSSSSAPAQAEDATFGRELEGPQQDRVDPKACDPTFGLG